MTRTQKQIQSEQTKLLIINKSIDLFSQKGFNATSISDLALATGLTKGAIYHHFENKDAIFYGVLENVRHLWRENVLRNMLGKSSSIERLKTLFVNHDHLLKENENICMVLGGLVMEMDKNNAEFMVALEEIFADLTLFIKMVIEKGQKSGDIRKDLDSHIIALSIVGMMEGSSIPRILNRNKIDFEALADAERKIILDGLKK